MTTAVSVFEKEDAKRFTSYDVELTFRDKLLGGIPNDPKLIPNWLMGRAGIDGTEMLRQRLIETVADLGYDTSELTAISEMEALKAAVVELVGEIKTVVFKRNGHGLYIEDRNIKAMLKESAAVMYPTQFFSRDTGAPTDRNVQTSKGLKSLIAEKVFVTEREVLLGREVADEVLMHVGIVQGRSIVGFHEAAVKPVLRFKIKVLKDSIPSKVWVDLWVHAQSNGLGAKRSMGFGTFLVTKWEKLA